MHIRSSATFVALVLIFASCPGKAQQGAVTFHHFKPYPNGQWSTQGQAFHNGSPMGAPQSTNSCSASPSALDVAKMKALGNSAAPTCKMRVLVDEPLTAEYEQVCSFGPTQQVIHGTLRAVDDKTLTTDIRMAAPDGGEMRTKITAHYLGACSAADAAAAKAAPSITKPDAETCAEIPQMKKDAQEALHSCSQLPAAYQADCASRIQGALRVAQSMEAGCK